jgi:hypothetical protein
MRDSLRADRHVREITRRPPTVDVEIPVENGDLRAQLDLFAKKLQFGTRNDGGKLGAWSVL